MLVEARGDVQEAIDMAHYMAAFGRLPHGQLVASERPDIFCAARRVPVGVVGMITPWNFPIAVPSWKLFPALLAGNTVVWKPAEDTPGLAVRFVELLLEAGLPTGVVNLVTGYGEEAGAALVEAQGVATLSFTGSTAVGRQLAARCGQLLKRMSCELGGKNAIVVLEDADLELAVKGALWSAFGTAGQRCTAASRLIVDRRIKARFTERLVEETQKLRLGIGVDPEAQIGPVVNAAQLARIHRYVELGQQEGARLLIGGRALTEAPFAAGSFSRSAERRNMLRTTAARTNHRAWGPIADHATPAMKNAGQPNSVNARAAARQTETYEIRVLDARTTGMRGVSENLAIGVPRSLFSPLSRVVTSLR